MFLQCMVTSTSVWECIYTFCESDLSIPFASGSTGCQALHGMRVVCEHAGRNRNSDDGGDDDNSIVLKRNDKDYTFMIESRTCQPAALGLDSRFTQGRF